MAGVPDYSTTAVSNTMVGGVNIAEGMAPGSVNNGMRAMMADSKKWQLDWSGIVTAGSANAYTVATNQGFTAYATGLRLTIKADRTNTGAATLSVDGLGAKSLRKVEGGALVALVAGDIADDAIYDVVFDSVLDVFIATNIAPALDADLTAIAGLSSTGMIARTGAGTAAVRTITGTAPVAVTNGNGVSGNPTIALGSITSIQTTITDTDAAIPTSGAVVDYVSAQTGWQPYDGGTGVFYQFLVNGAVSAVETPAFEDGFEYKVVMSVLSSTASSRPRFRIYRSATAAYGGYVNLSTADQAATLAWSMDHEYQLPRLAKFTHTTTYLAYAGTHATPTDGSPGEQLFMANFTHTGNEKIDKAEYSFTAGNIDSGAMILLRRRSRF